MGIIMTIRPQNLNLWLIYNTNYEKITPENGRFGLPHIENKKFPHYYLISNKANTSIDQEVLASALTRLGLWRLRPYVTAKLCVLMTRVEGILRQCCFDDGLDVYRAEQFEYRDNLDPTGEKDKSDPFFATHTPNNKHINEDSSRLQLENRTYTSRVFSIINLGLLVRQDGLQVFQMVAYPRIGFDLPIINVCFIANKNSVELAFVDPSPVRREGSFPAFYADAITRLARHFSLTRMSINFEENFYSPLCITLRPINEEETDRFIQYTCSVIRTHFEIARMSGPVKLCHTKLALELIEGRRRFCIQQQKNTIIKRILVASFGEKEAEDYLSKFLFSKFEF